MATISTFSMAAAMAYVVTALLALACALGAPRRQHRAAMLHWIVVALVFAGLAAWRLTDGEGHVQAYARNWAQIHGTYDDRHDWQAPIAILALLVVVATGFAGARWAGPRASGRALCLAVVMVLFAGLRLVSLHAVDEILYRALGPIHLNYVIDLGLTGLVVVLALVDLGWVGQASPPARRSRSRSRSRGSGGDRHR